MSTAITRTGQHNALAISSLGAQHAALAFPAQAVDFLKNSPTFLATLRTNNPKLAQWAPHAATIADALASAALTAPASTWSRIVARCGLTLVPTSWVTGAVVLFDQATDSISNLDAGLFIAACCAVFCAGAVATAGAGRAWNQPGMLSLPDRAVAGARRLFVRAPEQHVQQALQNPAATLQFFADHPAEFAAFLQKDLSTHLRTAQGEARTTMDSLDALRGQLEATTALAISNLEKNAPVGAAAAITALRANLTTNLARLASARAPQQEFCDQVDQFLTELNARATTILAEAATHTTITSALAAVNALSAQVPGAVAASNAQLTAHRINIEAHMGELQRMATAITAHQAALAEVATFRATELPA